MESSSPAAFPSSLLRYCATMNLRASFLFFLLLLSPLRLLADHVFGGELGYTHVSGNTYKITLTVYGDCGTATLSSFNLLPNATPVIQVFNQDVEIDTIMLRPAGSGLEVTPVCQQEANNSKCVNPTSTLPGIKRFIYERIYTLPSASTHWKFVFNGLMGGGHVAGRSTNITNLTIKGNVTLTATLNNSGNNNNSPQLTTIPTPFYCINVSQEFNQGAIDSENDSLVFELIPAITAGQVAIYAGGFSGFNPISTHNGNFSFNSVNGQMKFTPDMVQNGVVVNRVSEYRNGVLIGSVEREMTFIVLANCQNNPPSGMIDSTNVVGGILGDDNVINVCEGASIIEFEYAAADADGDTISVTHTPLPAGASLNIQNNQTPNPSLDFSWNTSGVLPGVYNFFVTLKDHHCPLSTQQTFGFTIRVVKQPSAEVEIIDSTRCCYKARVKYRIHNGLRPQKVDIHEAGQLVTSFIDSTGVFEDSLAAGEYTMTISSPYLDCPTTHNFTIEHGGEFPFLPDVKDAIICIGDETRPVNAMPYPGATVTWYDMSGSPLPGPPVPTSSAPGVYNWLVSQRYLVCNSRIDTAQVLVSSKPEVMITNPAQTHCLGDKVFLEATGDSLEFQWLPEDAYFYNPDSSRFVRLLHPVEYTVIGTNENGCKDTASIAFNDIQPCCNFSFPNAFSPNNDGVNDTWHPLMYGNHEHYELSIYNRWGERVFHSFTPNAGWDGTHKGVLQNSGTYYFLVKAKCLTGTAEEEKGEVYLIR